MAAIEHTYNKNRGHISSVLHREKPQAHYLSEQKAGDCNYEGEN